MASGAAGFPLPPGSTIGILGGGQLGRMLALAAAELGLKVHVFCPEPDSPAFEVAREAFVADYDDEAALARFADGVDVVTFEFENVPLAAAEKIAARRPLRPGPTALATTQDRLAEKSFVSGLGIATARFGAVEDRASLAQAVGMVGRPAVLKTRRFGYDGKGQAMLREGLDLDAAWGMIERQPAILESFVPFEREVSVVAARSADGAFAAYDPIENRHEHHILRTSRVPAALPAEAAAEAAGIAKRIAEALDYVGVIAVEMFVCREADGRASLLVNEIAPRVHNSGHWTIEGAATSQFEQHIRAIAGWPLGSTALVAPTEMTNLLGDEAAAWQRLAAEPGTHLHLYGKAEARPGRKMGHVTRLRQR